MKAGRGHASTAWEVRTLGDLCDITIGRTPSRAVDAFWGGDIPWLSIGDMGTKHITSSEEGITESAARLMTVIPAGTLVMSFKLTIGKLGFVARDMYSNEAICALRNPRIDPEFLYYALGAIDLTRYGKQAVKGATLNKESLASIEVPIPPTQDEQSAIAAVLGDIDAWIGVLSQSAAKKRGIRRALADELVSGKRRLGSFSGKWQSTPLGEVGTWKGGGTPSMAIASYWKDGTIPWVSSGDVKVARLASTEQSITESAVSQSTTNVVPADAIVLVTRSGILRRYLPVARLMRPMAINQDIKAVIPHVGVDSEFLLHALTYAGPEILATCLKSGTTVESVEYSWLKAFELKLPSIEEQRAIATVLTDADEEVSALDQAVAKAQMLKLAVAQELLAGRTRLT
ncbi:MAG: restriction endonuclease subunit S [Microbacterium sp.]|nr:restriction endonuclease subunit S [Microbacterium sp.]